jgi:hypothetical protein
MPSLKENIAALKRAEIAKRAETEAQLLLKVSAARAEEGSAAKALDDRKAKLAAVVATPIDRLPDDEKVIEERVRVERVAEARLKIAETALADAQAALAAAEAELKADADVQSPAFDKLARARDRMAEDFDNRFPEHAEGLFDLIKDALAIEALAAQAKGKASGAPGPTAPGPEFARGQPNSACLRIEFVDASGAVLWRGDQFSNSSTDPQARRNGAK